MDPELVRLEREMFIDYLETSKGMAENTVKSYLYQFDRFNGCANISQKNINYFIRSFGYHVMIRGFFVNYFEFLLANIWWLEKNGKSKEEVRDIIIPKKTGREKRKIPVVLSPDEITGMARRMRQERDKLLLYVAYFGGMRCSEVLSLTIRSFDFKGIFKKDDHDIFDVRITKAKGDKDRFVFLPAWLGKRLATWIQLMIDKGVITQEDYPIWMGRGGKVISRTAYKKMLKTYAPEGRNVYPHLLRHSFATHLFDAGQDIMAVKEFLGHVNVNTTQKYIHINPIKLRESHKKVIMNYF